MFLLSFPKTVISFFKKKKEKFNLNCCNFVIVCYIFYVNSFINFLTIKVHFSRLFVNTFSLFLLLVLDGVGVGGDGDGDGVELNVFNVPHLIKAYQLLLIKV